MKIQGGGQSLSCGCLLETGHPWHLQLAIEDAREGTRHLSESSLVVHALLRKSRNQKELAEAWCQLVKSMEERSELCSHLLVVI